MDQIIGNLDFPTGEKEYGPCFEIEGWACSIQGDPISIEILIDKNLVEKTSTNIIRHDVANAHTNIGNALKSGFYLQLDLDKFNDGNHNLEVIARSTRTINILRKIHFILDKNLLIPPRRLRYVGEGDFIIVGNNFLRHFIDLCEIKPDERILDVGCGVGRMALPLTRYLSNNGIYEGFDIVKDAIEWCNKKISTRYPNFRFTFANIRNMEYNPSGKYYASKYKFPYADKYFDFVFLTSVFTHLRPDEMENYLSEISRVLKRDGRCFLTYFLLNDISIDSMKSNSNLDFKYDFSQFKSVSQTTPESAIAFYEHDVMNLLAKKNLILSRPPLYGSWSGRKDCFSYQDIIVVKKNR